MTTVSWWPHCGRHLGRNPEHRDLGRTQVERVVLPGGKVSCADARQRLSDSIGDGTAELVALALPSAAAVANTGFSITHHQLCQRQSCTP